MSKRTKKTPKEFEDYSTKVAIRVAAERLCGEVGAPNVRLREIARRVGIEAASIYTYYQNLDDILASVAETALKDMLELQRHASSFENDNDVINYCQALVQYFAKKPGVARLILYDLASVGGHYAFNANIPLIREYAQIEAEMIAKSYDISDKDNMQQNDFVLAKLGMTLTMLSERWIRGHNVTEKTAKQIGADVAAYMLGRLKQYKKLS